MSEPLSAEREDEIREASDQQQPLSWRMGADLLDALGAARTERDEALARVEALETAYERAALSKGRLNEKHA